MASVGERPFAAPELERVRAHHLGNLSDMYAKNSTFALHLAELFGQGGSPGEFARLYERVRSVTAAELKRAAVAWFRRDRVQVAVVANPYENGQTLRRFGNVEWFKLEVQTVD
jgi:predicted Zn-dependent peptidase